MSVFSLVANFQYNVTQLHNSNIILTHHKDILLVLFLLHSYVFHLLHTIIYIQQSRITNVFL